MVYKLDLVSLLYSLDFPNFVDVRQIPAEDFRHARAVQDESTPELEAVFFAIVVHPDRQEVVVQSENAAAHCRSHSRPYPGKPFPVNRSLFLFQCLSCCLEGGSVVHRLGLQDVDLHARVGHVDEVRHLRRSDDHPVVVLNHAHFDEHVLDSLRGVVRIAPDGVTVVDADGQPGRLEWRRWAPVKRNDGLRVFLPLPIPFGRKEE